MAELFERLQAALAPQYRLDRELGAGGMATVFLAEDLRHGRSVALKVLQPDLAVRIGARRFLREIQVAAGLHHPHILPLYDSGEADGYLYYVMPYLEGDSLRDRLAREGELPVEDSLRIAREVADALSYAHEHGVIHRDIKPANILLQGDHAVVADFGIARVVTDVDAETVTSEGVVLGTPAYMSPEQVSGSAHLDGRSDVYSLGCVLYEMLAGQPPFTGTTFRNVARQHLSLEAPDVSVLRPAVPGWVAAVVRQALSKAPSDRFYKMEDFAAALAGSQAGPPATEDSAPTVPVSSKKAVPWRKLPALLAGAIAVAAIVLFAVRWARERTAPPAQASPAHGRNEVAVLPFQNLSPGGPHAYFADGFQDALLTELAKVASLKVISRTSVMEYRDSTKPLKEIAAELGVGSVVEGSVQVVADRVRLTVQLIDAATDEHLWADTYDRTLDDVFATQSDVAQRIVAAVGVALSTPVQTSLATPPTANAEAYLLFLQGQEYRNRPGRLQDNLEAAEQLYERAIALDPQFALAHAMLSQVDGQLYWYRMDPTADRAAKQLAEAQTALRIAPDLPQAHMAMGLAYYFGRRDFQAALNELQVALRGLPNDAELWSRIGYVQRRLGNWDEVFAAYDKTLLLNPRAVTVIMDLGAGSYRQVGRYEDAIRAYDLALTLAPDLYDAAIQRAMTYIAWQGQLDTLRVTLDRIPEDVDVLATRAFLLFWERDADDLLQLLENAHVDIVEDDQTNFTPTSLYLAWAHDLRGNSSSARVAYDSALVRIDAAIAERPADWAVHASRGMALAGLGRREEALQEAAWLAHSEVYRNDPLTGRDVAETRAKILARAGDVDGALDEIERQLAQPGQNASGLRLDPLWDPIREDPRFKALLAKYSRSGN